MKNFFSLLICASCLFFWNTAKGQQDAQFTQFMFNQLFFNPGYAGIAGNTQISFIYRQQWAAYNPSFDDGGAPSTQVLSFNTAFPKFNSGLGVHIVSDRLGPLTNLEMQLSYAYHVKVSDKAKLSLGLRGGVYSKIVDYDKYNPRERPDDLIGEEGFDANTKPDFAVGVYYQSDKLFAGLSTNHITQSEFNLAGFNQSPLARSYYLMGGYNFALGRDGNWILTPNFLVKVADFKEYSFDVGGLVTYDNKFWVGSSFRNEESVNMLIGANIPSLPRNKAKQTRTLRISYSFDYVFAGQTAKQPTSHEVVLSYLIPV